MCAYLTIRIRVIARSVVGRVIRLDKICCKHDTVKSIACRCNENAQFGALHFEGLSKYIGQILAQTAYDLKSTKLITKQNIAERDVSEMSHFVLR